MCHFAFLPESVNESSCYSTFLLAFDVVRVLNFDHFNRFPSLFQWSVLYLLLVTHSHDFTLDHVITKIATLL